MRVRLEAWGELIVLVAVRLVLVGGRWFWRKIGTKASRESDLKELNAARVGR